MPNNTAINAALPGLSRLAASFGGGGQGAYQQGYDAELAGRSRLAQAMAAAKASEAAARAHDASAASSLSTADQNEAETDILRGRPGALDEGVAYQTGSTLPMVNAVREFVRTGTMPQRELPGPPTEEGVGAGSAPLVDDAQRGAIAQALFRSLPMRTNLKDTSVKEFADAQGQFATQDQDAGAITGAVSPAALAVARYAAKGNAPYHFDSSGLVGNNLTGALDEGSGRAKAVTGKEAALGTQATAGATENNAQAKAALAAAAAHYASAEKARVETGLTRDAPKGVLVQTADGPVFADPRTGVSTPVTVNGATAKPAKGKGAAAMSATLQKELIESDETVQSSANVVRTLEEAKKINKDAYSGYFAKQRAVIASNLPGATPGADATIDIDNMMTGQALESLRGTFGAAPTEGERKILMDMQASADKTPKQREAIMDRAIAAAKRRAVFAKNKAESIRSGDYLTESPGALEPDGLSADEAAELAALKARLGRK